MTRLSRLLPAFALALFILAWPVSCADKPEVPDDVSGDNSQVETPGENEENPEEPWTGDYPKGIELTQFTETFSDGKVCNGWYSIIDFSVNSNLKFFVSHNTPKKTPGEIYSKWEKKVKGEPAICVNAGYFAGATSVSLAIDRKVVKSRGFMGFNWPNDENYERTVYAVRSAIGQMEDGSFEIQWAYCTNAGSNTITAFPSALGNDEKTRTFIDEPSADYPGAFTWTPYSAVGGGPRIVQDGKDVSEVNYWAECLDSGGTAGLTRQPRTGVGITPDGKLILIVCDGRGKGGSAGYTLKEMAGKFISLGACDAINLDGGGSSAIIGKDGECLNNPSDGSQRPVVTAIMIAEMKNE